MTRIIAALLAAATIAGVAAPAAAQTKYFARERLVSLSTAQSAGGSWKSSVETTQCVGGSRIGTTTSTCEGGSCGDPKPADRTRTIGPCMATCEPLASSMRSKDVEPTLARSNVTNLADAQSVCVELAQRNGGAAICNWRSAASVVYLFGSPGNEIQPYSNAGFYAARCTLD